MDIKSLNQNQIFTREEVEKSTLEYFNGDERATELWIEKYCLKNKEKGEYYELTPDAMHRRLAGGFFEIERKYKEPMTEDEIYHLLKGFEYIVTTTNDYSEGKNNPCFTGDTLVSVADGRGYVSFKQLVEEGKDVEVYSESDNKVITIKTMRNPRITAKNQKIYKITFTSGETIRATKNHKFYLSNNEKVELCDLKKGQKLRVISRYKNTRGSGIMNRDSRLYGDLPNFIIRSVQEDGVEDVYNGTVDLYHNYFVGNFNGKVSGVSRLGSSIKVANCGEKSTPLYGTYLSLNLYGYVTNKFLPNAIFEDEMFVKHVGCLVRLADDIIDSKIDKIDKELNTLSCETKKTYWEGIKKGLVEKRKSKVSLTGLTDMMAALGIKNGTEESLLFSEKLHQLFSTSVYESSIELAEERGHFPIWNTWDIKKSGFLTRMFTLHKNELMTQEVRERLFKFGRRNVSMLSNVKGTDVGTLTQNSEGISSLDKIIWYQGNYADIVFHKPFIDFYSKVTGITFELAKEILSDLTKVEVTQIFEKSPYFKSLTGDIGFKEAYKAIHSIKKWSDGTSENFYKIKK